MSGTEGGHYQHFHRWSLVSLTSGDLGCMTFAALTKTYDSVTIISVVRLNFVLALDIASPDVTWNGSDEMMWTGIEVNVATVCGTS